MATNQYRLDLKALWLREDLRAAHKSAVGAEHEIDRPRLVGQAAKKSCRFDIDGTSNQLPFFAQ